MPRNQRSRRQRTRRLPPRPPSGDARRESPGDGTAAPAAAETRPARLVQREAPYLRVEMRRVALVSAACFGVLAFLVVVERFG